MKRTLTTMIALLVLSAGAAAANMQDPPKPPKAAPTPKPEARAFTMFSSSGKGQSYLGVDIREITADRVAPLKLKEERGVEITMVDRDAPAGKAGLKEGDVVLEFNGARVEGEEQLRRLLRETPAGRKVTLGISRDGQPMQIEATLAARETMMRAAPGRVIRVNPEINLPDIQIPAVEMVWRSYSRRTGMMVDNLTPQLGEFFGVKSGEGVLVRSVEKGSAAEAAGLKAGDVITKVDNEAIDDRNDWNRVLRRKGGPMTLTIVRDKREQSVTINLPEVKGGEEGRFFEWDSDTGFNYEFNTERLDKALRHLRELDADRIVERHVRVQKTLAESMARTQKRMEQMQERMQKDFKERQEKMQKRHEDLRLKLERAARSYQMV